jgi:hypothetical protein
MVAREILAGYRILVIKFIYAFVRDLNIISQVSLGTSSNFSNY